MAPVRRPPRTTRYMTSTASMVQRNQSLTIQTPSNQTSSSHTSSVELVSSQKPQGVHPQLLNPQGDQILRLGVDFGSGNTSCQFVVVGKDQKGYFEHIGRTRALHMRNESIRFPTVVAIKPWEEDPRRASLLFGDEASKLLHSGEVSFNMMFFYQKLGLIEGYDGIFASDKTSIQQLHLRHDKSLEFAAQFDEITVDYPGSNTSVKITIKSIEDIILQTLKYFLALVKTSIRHKLKLDSQQTESVFQLNTEVGFAAPTFWKDSMLDRFLHLVEKAGWPKKAKIWSEPKCALAAHLASEWMDLAYAHRLERRDALLKTAMVIVDIGAGSLDATSARVVEVTDSTIKLATIAESSGSLCGGYLLNKKIEHRLKSLFGRDLLEIRQGATQFGEPTINTEDFMQNFLYDDGRLNFEFEEQVVGEQDDFEFHKVESKAKRKCLISYGPRSLPPRTREYITAGAVKISA